MEASRRRSNRKSRKPSEKVGNNIPTTLCIYEDVVDPDCEELEMNDGVTIINQQNRKLNSDQFDIILENMWNNYFSIEIERKKLFKCIDCLWFDMYMTQETKPKVLNWIKKQDIFSKKYVFIPIVCWGHWRLVILCNFGECIHSETIRPCMLLLDSLNSADPKTIEPNIRMFIKDICREEGKTEIVESLAQIPLLVPKVPQQQNSEDCGIYVLYYINLFMKNAPEDVSISESYSNFMNENWFNIEGLETFWNEIFLCASTNLGQFIFHEVDKYAASGDTTASHRLIRKFVASSSKSIALNTLSHLLSSDVHRYCSLALPMYERITQTTWFTWNSKLISSVIASLEKQGYSDEAQVLISESIQKLEFRNQEIALFYCDLIHVFAKNGLKESVFNYYSQLKELLSGSTSSSLNRKAFEYMISALCTLDLPNDAEEVMKEMNNVGFNPSGFEFRLIVLAYGKSGLFDKMKRVLDQMKISGYVLDTICFNVVLSSYGNHGKISEIVLWIQKMKNSNTPLSIRTYNTVLNSCSTIIAFVQDPKSLPLSIKELMEKLTKDEVLLIRELMDSSVLLEKLEWSSSEGKLDLHGMHLGSVYVILLQWIEELRMRFCCGSWMIPAEITVVCGLGKHSSIRGKSPVKALVSELMVRLKSPMRIDRKNVGCFVAKGKNVRNWLC
ncbi:pentatricopeptide (PPR) repeat-containing protein [Thalictrum thalictroides]|uniref:Pentatricopeptide (PPR) repeat-containing protein n=1 Tax=Thalictrum thalictroides TaxID=46969 RepID=A0A7J6V4G6_THATH|nr:pentatricopeptide (PPR) repeat-containing protein [Thalictrum thalictroides]